MEYFLTILLSFYPTMLIYSSIPADWMRRLDGLIPAGSGFFFSHLAVFLVIFTLSYIVLAKFLSIGYGSRAHRSITGMTLLIAFVFGLGVISFYNILPGNMIYESPGFLDKYLLNNPYTFLAMLVPLGYLYFD